MKLARCSECDRIIDLDEIEELDGDEVIGCGLNQGEYMPCEDCSGNAIPDKCRELRHENENAWTKTTVAELEDSI